MYIAHPFSIPYQTPADAVILNIHMKYISMEAAVYSLYLFQKGSALVQVVDKVCLLYTSDAADD